MAIALKLRDPVTAKIFVQCIRDAQLSSTLRTKAVKGIHGIAFEAVSIAVLLKGVVADVAPRLQRLVPSRGEP